jgi:hypothetical protein
MNSIVSDAVYTLSNQMNQVELDKFNAGIAGISSAVSNLAWCFRLHWSE